MQCPEGHPVNDEHLFCGECGSPVTVGSAPQGKRLLSSRRGTVVIVAASILLLALGGGILAFLKNAPSSEAISKGGDSADAAATRLIDELSKTAAAVCDAPRKEGRSLFFSCKISRPEELMVFVYDSQDQMRQAQAPDIASDDPWAFIREFRAGELEGENWLMLLTSNEAKDDAQELASALGGRVKYVPTARTDEDRANQCIEVASTWSQEILGGNPAYDLNGLARTHGAQSFEFKLVAANLSRYGAEVYRSGFGEAVARMLPEIARVCMNEYRL